ncbi:hypothetical protein KHS38_09650 [Mucilaginibacter sp. Bleaf8]|uniref:DUF6712 family protein n=1 Tax=Mucilaginibacter sp. Bleaf8 TaxID=2834430 RepID=UPI001BCDFA34|nr:hypothetical protein [Mucilaginibacter sp. Bleaf8]MBS7564667.1 hypothetical protein [Mucilaginibacter sp. Bleaf8]
MNTLLIDTAAFQQYEDISINIKPERLQAFIKKAQELDLKPFLSAAFYYELQKWMETDGQIKEDAPVAYQNLLKGCEYTDQWGHIISFEGLIAMLVYFTFARFIEGNSVFYTATGPVIKQYDNAQAVSPQDVIKLVQQQRSIANAYANNVEKFLQDNQSQYPLWYYNSRNKTARQPGPRIRSVDKTDFNYPTQMPLEDYYLTLNNF